MDMAEAEVQEPGALDEVLQWNGTVHVFFRVQETGPTGRPELTYLWFIPPIAMNVIAYVTYLYMLLKDSSGSLKPRIDWVEGTVKDVVEPLYQKIDGKPQAILTFADGKVDDAVHYLEGLIPPHVKQLTSKAYEATRSTLEDVQKDGIYGTAKVYFDKYKPVAESYGVHAYMKALTFPLVPEAVTVTRYIAVKINEMRGGGSP